MKGQCCSREVVRSATRHERIERRELFSVGRNLGGVRLSRLAAPDVHYAVVPRSKDHEAWLRIRHVRSVCSSDDDFRDLPESLNWLSRAALSAKQGAEKSDNERRLQDSLHAVLQSCPPNAPDKLRRANTASKPPRTSRAPAASASS